MRFLIVNTCYDRFVRWFYSQNPQLAHADYQGQLDAHNASLFGIADAYTRSLRAMGHEAFDVHVNIRPLQQAWAAEHGLTLPRPASWQFRLRRGVVPWISRVRDRSWLYRVLAAQIEHYQPDVILNHNIYLDSDFFRKVRGKVGLLIGQHAADLPTQDLSGYDLMLSSLPNQVEHFQRLGIFSRLFRLGFDPAILPHLPPAAPIHDVVFVGSIGPAHSRGTQVLERVCRQFQRTRVFGIGADNLPHRSAIRRCYGGPLWGRDMYAALRQARIVLNRHLNAAGSFANNMRLYETTGVGAFLLTDAKDNLADMFAPGCEVGTYRNGDECIYNIRYYLDHDSERRNIAEAGQQRTLQNHTYHHRMMDLLSIVAETPMRRPSSGALAQAASKAA